MSLHTLKEKLAKRFPTAVLELDEPVRPEGNFLLDVQLGGHSVTVEWRKRRGFGISSRPDLGYGEGVDETYTKEADALQRIISLLLSRTSTTPPVKIRELRESLGLSQTELAQRMSIQQATISKLESGRDRHLSTLHSLATALGCHLSISLHFPDGSHHQLDLHALIGQK